MIEDSCLDIEMLLEEFDASSKAVYMPPRDGLVYAYVPLTANPSYEGVSAAMEAPTKVISGKGRTRAQTLMIFPPGSEVVRIASLEKGADVDEALSHILVDLLEVVESLKVVRSNDTYILEMSRTQSDTRFPRFKVVPVLLLTSIIGCILATVLWKPVMLVNEDLSIKKVTVSFKVLE
jgi:hypothetical protein